MATPQGPPPASSRLTNVRVKSTECKTKCGMVVEADKIIKLTEAKFIKDAATLVCDNIVNYWMKKVIETNGDKLELFYIGKSFIDEKKGQPFSLANDSTWDLEDGVKSRYKAHKVKDHCKNSLIVVAVLQDGCIPDHCISNQCFISHQEYALMLETRLIQRFMKNDEYKGKLKNTGTDSGGESKKNHVASVIYMTFSVKGIANNSKVLHHDVDIFTTIDEIKRKLQLDEDKG